MTPETHSPTPLTRRDWLLAAAWALAALVVYGAGIGLRDLWDPDEPRYAEVAREMLEQNQYLVPHINGRVYGHKPPLFFWTVAGVGCLFGAVDGATARAPSVVSAALLLAAIFLFAVRRFGRRAAGFAAAVLAGNYLYLSLATHANIDMMHALFTCGALLLWFEAHDRERVAALPALAAWALGGLAILTKGVGGLLLLLVAIAGLTLARRWRDRRALSFNGCGILLMIAIAGAWYFPARATGGGDYGNEIGLRQTIERFFNPWSHERSPVYFFYNFPLDVLPWSLFLPGVIVWLRDRWRNAGAGLERFLAVWFCVVFVFFSLSMSKRHIYLLPLVPAWALLSGAWLAQLEGLPLLARAPGWILAGALALAGAVGLAAPLWVGSLPLDADVGAAVAALAPAFAVAGATALAGAGALARTLQRADIAQFAAAVTATVAALTLLVFAWILPGLNGVRSARAFVEAMNRTAGWEARVACFGPLQEEMVFYAHRYLTPEIDHGGEGSRERERADLAAYLDAPTRDWCVMREKDWKKLGALAERMEVAHRGRAGGDVYVLLREK